MFPFEELDPHLQRLLPFFDDDGFGELLESATCGNCSYSSSPYTGASLFDINCPLTLKTSMHAFQCAICSSRRPCLAGALSTDAYVEEWGDWSLTMKESKTAMLLHPGDAHSLPDDRRPVRARTAKDPQPPVMPTGKPGPCQLEAQSKLSRRPWFLLCPGGKLSTCLIVPTWSLRSAPPTKKSRGGKSVTNKPKAILSKKKTASKPAPSCSTRSQAKRSPSPAHKPVGDPAGDEEDDQANEEENLEELNTVTSGPGIGGIPVINRRNHKLYLPPSMIPGEGVYLFPTVEPEPIKKDEVLVFSHFLTFSSPTIPAYIAPQVPTMSPVSSAGGETIATLAIVIRTQAIAYVEATPTNVRKHLEQALDLRHLYELSANTTANIASQYHAVLRSVFDLTLRVACTEAPSSLRLVLSDPDLPHQLFIALEQALTARAIPIPELNIASPEDNSSLVLPGISLSHDPCSSVHSTGERTASPRAESPGSPHAESPATSARGLEDVDLEGHDSAAEDQLSADEAQEKKDTWKKRRSNVEESDEQK
ncbi:hypothetical protein IW262DRAFT_1465148 [Armillaria fumosa]|nr:hypothetical protein IW262DRAFT_1465148 [Armillaria fumosa]